MPLIPPPYAIDIGERTLRVLQLAHRRWLDPNRGAHRLVGLTERAIPEGWIRDGIIREGDRLARAIRTAVAHTGGRWLRSSFAIAALPELRTYTTTVTVRPAGDETLRTAADRLLPSVLPVDPTTCVLAVTPVAVADGATIAAVTAVQTDIARSYAAVLSAAGLTPLGLDVESAAITRAVTYRPTENSHRLSSLIVDLGATRTSALLVTPTVVATSVTIPVAGLQLTAAVAAALKISLPTAEHVKRSTDLDRVRAGDRAATALAAALVPLIDGIERLRRFAADHLPPTLHPQRVILTGGGCLLRGLDRFVAERTRLPVDRFEIPTVIGKGGVAVPPPSTGLATAFGIGLLGLDPAAMIDGGP